MEPHPIPQNVTSFQFHLVGDMTLKQFLYLAGGAGFAYLIFVTVAKDYPLVAWPLIIISSLLGLAFAFLPFASRPLDYWVATFLKTIYSPTKRSWKKMGQGFRENPLFKSRYVMYVASLGPQPVKESAPPAPPPPSLPSLPTTEDLGKTVDLARQAQGLQVRIIQAERALHQIRNEATKPSPVPIDYSQQVSEIMSELQKLVSQASQIRSRLDEVKPPPPLPPLPIEKVKVVIPVKPKQAQVALTTFPNVINGIIKDLAGNYLEAVVTVIYDKEGLPVRALKTNKLGQFSGSTPLPNGTYTLELEKEGYNFDVLQVELGGQVLPPLIITAKAAGSSS
ncbi:PrgI family protein [Candidatus Daviesbacteria bacterium]|nr:PrgI family protein [Candidatus Daviesbacteria bacterium]